MTRFAPTVLILAFWLLSAAAQTPPAPGGAPPAVPPAATAENLLHALAAGEGLAPGTGAVLFSEGSVEARIQGTGEAHLYAGTREAQLPPPGADAIAKPEDLMTRTTNEIAYALNWNIAHPGEAAIAYFAKLAELYPDRAQMHGRLAMAYLQTARYDEALASGARALELDPKEPWALLTVAMIRQERCEDELAVDALKTLLAGDIDPIYRELCLVTREFLNARLASSLSALGRHEEAEAAILESLKTRTVSDDLNFGAKMVERFRLVAGEPEKAKKIYEDNLALDPKDFNALVQLAALHVHLGEPDRAFPLLSRALEVSGDYIKPYFHLFRAHFRKGDLKEAKKALERCAQIEYAPQKRLELETGLVCLLPSPSELLMITHLALGNWDKFVEIERMHFTQESTPNITPFVVEDFFTDVEGRAEYSLEEAMRFHLRTHEKEKIENPWLPEFEKVLLPARKGARSAFDKAAAHLVKEEYGKALEQADLGLKEEAGNPGLLVQKAIAARGLNRTEEVWATAGALRAIPVDRVNAPLAALARDFSVLAALEPYTVKRVRVAGERKFLRALATRGLPEAQIAEIGSVYEEIEAAQLAFFEASDSVTERAFASLLLTNVYANLASMPDAGRWYGFCYKRDKDFKIIRWIFARFGRYFGI